MKKMLLIFSRPPYPLIGGDKIRMYQHLKNLSQNYNVDVLFINDNKTDSTINFAIKKYANNVYNFDFKKWQFQLNTILGFILNKNPLQVNYYKFKKVQHWIDSNIHKYDTVFCSTIRTSEYVYKKDIYKIIDFVDAISMNYQKAYKESKFGLWKLMYKIDKKKLLKYEQKILPYFDRKLIISEIDQNFIIQKSTNPIPNFKVLFNSVEITSKVEIPSEENYIIFVGKMDYEPNVNAVKYFCAKVFPSLQQLDTSLKFYIAGVKPTSAVKKLAATNKNVIVTGYVKDLNRLILRSKIVVAPMVSGAGIQNKILLAMSLKKCVVTTPIGAEGLNTSNKQLIISKNATVMIRDLITLLSKNEYRMQVAEGGFNYVKDNFSEKAIRDELLSFVKIKQ